MGMGMGMHLTMRQSQSLELGQKQEMLLGLSQTFREVFDGIRSDLSLDIETIGNVVFERFLVLAKQQVRDPDVYEALAGIFTDKGNITYLTSKIGNFADATVNGFGPVSRSSLIDALPRDSSGRVTLEGQSSLASTSQQIEKAFNDPDNLRAEIEKMTELARSQRDAAGEGLIGAISEAQSALKICEALTPSFNLMENTLKLAFRVKSPDNDPLLTTFFREAAVLASLDWELSDRISCRFVTRFANLKINSPGHEYRDAMVNTISEFLMVSMGVLDPSLFQKMKGEVKELDVLLADQHVDDRTDGDVSLVESLRKYQLKEKGPIYWCRWAVQDSSQAT